MAVSVCGLCLYVSEPAENMCNTDNRRLIMRKEEG